MYRRVKELEVPECQEIKTGSVYEKMLAENETQSEMFTVLNFFEMVKIWCDLDRSKVVLKLKSVQW